jgi:trans-aconitate methyltransferase
MDANSWPPLELERNRFVRFRTAHMFDRFVGLARDGHWRVLDFGCGFGHSIEVLLERFPNAHFVGVDVNEDVMSEFASRFGGHERVTFVHLKSPLAFEDIGDGFDLIQLNAVFEHLLPDERKEVMPLLWRRLASTDILSSPRRPGAGFQSRRTRRASHS